MIRLFYTTIPESHPDGSIVSKREAVRLLHNAAWSLLAVSLHDLDPVHFPGVRPEELPEIEKNPYGKPAFADASLPGFSLSHSGAVAACAVSECGAVGVDVQKTSEMKGGAGIDDIARRFFHPREQEYYFSHEDPDERFMAFYTIFSCKEAYVKLTGKGMSENFESFYTAFDGTGIPVGIHNGKTGNIVGCPVLADPILRIGDDDHVLAACTLEPAEVTGPVHVVI